MSEPVPFIRLQTSADTPQLTHLHEQAFGPGRFTRTAYRLRERSLCEPQLNLCAEREGMLIGAVQFTPIRVAGHGGALLLGPLVIHEAYKNQGWGLKLMLEGLARAKGLGYKIVFLVGDEPYYARAGFVRVDLGSVTMPGPVDPARLLYKELAPGALPHFKGVMEGSL